MEHLALLPPSISVPIGILLALLLAFDKIKSFSSEAFGRGKRFALLKQKLEIIRLATDTGMLRQDDDGLRSVVYDDIQKFLGYEPEKLAQPASPSFFVKTLRAGWLIGFGLFVLVTLLNIAFSDAWMEETDFYIGAFFSFQIGAILWSVILAYTVRGLRRAWAAFTRRTPPRPLPDASPAVSAASK